jgi:hypothetical protein
VHLGIQSAGFRAIYYFSQLVLHFATPHSPSQHFWELDSLCRMEETNGHYAPNMRAVPAGEFVRPSRKTNGAGVQAEDTRICVVMVGLPARGKSLIAQKGKLF